MKLLNKKVTVFGAGISGRSALKLLKREGAKVSLVNRGEPSDWYESLTSAEKIDFESCYNQEDPFISKIFRDSDLIILSPGIPKDHPVLELANQKKVLIWSEIELGYQFAKAPIIAITGTNGKTTTVTMLGEMIKNCGKSVFIGGNIGIPFCECFLSEKNYDYILLELSSFQLESIVDFRPFIACILNIYSNHGERYESIDGYVRAKQTISKNMTKEDWVLYPEEFLELKKWGENSPCKKVSFTSEVKTELEKIFDLSEFHLPGNHNLSNLNVCYQIIKILGLEKSGVQKTISEFMGVSHRIEYLPVSGRKTLTFYNDAKSTNWDATLNAVNAVKEEQKKLLLILGGQKRGRGDSILPYRDLLKTNVNKIFLIGETTENIEEEIKGFISHESCLTIENALSEINKMNGDFTVLFSPAFPSFDQFKDYADRGNSFKKLVAEKFN